MSEIYEPKQPFCMPPQFRAYQKWLKYFLYFIMWYLTSSVLRFISCSFPCIRQAMIKGVLCQVAQHKTQSDLCEKNPIKNLRGITSAMHCCHPHAMKCRTDDLPGHTSKAHVKPISSNVMTKEQRWFRALHRLEGIANLD